MAKLLLGKDIKLSKLHLDDKFWEQMQKLLDNKEVDDIFIEVQNENLNFISGLFAPVWSGKGISTKWPY